MKIYGRSNTTGRSALMAEKKVNSLSGLSLEGENQGIHVSIMTEGGNGTMTVVICPEDFGRIRELMNSFDANQTQRKAA